MKRLLIFVSYVEMLYEMLDECGGAKWLMAAETEPPATGPAATGPAVTEAPVGSGTATLITIDLAGPPMEVGSKYTYIDGSVLVAVPGGPFTMGSKSNIDNPERVVTISDFWIYNSEVTNQEYSLCVAAGQCTVPDPKDNPQFDNYRYINYPIVGVNHQQSVDYCTFVHARLPTEAEWEKAARGPYANIFPWGSNAPVCDLLNFNFCKGKTIDIQTYPDGVSYYGLFDMSGNVREWAADWYDAKYNLDGKLQDPLGAEQGEKRSIRSSSFEDGGDFAISAHRFALKPTEHLPDLGFRCVVEDPTYFAPLCTQLAYIGAGPNGSEGDCIPEVKCNKVSITDGQSCTSGNAPYTIITFHVSNTPPTGWSYDVPGCTPLGGDQFQCGPPAGSFTATATGSCADTKSCDPACPVHYNKVGDACIWDGSGTIGTECIAGTTYDPVNQCCAATPGSGVNFSVCPDGYYPLGGVCVKDPTAVVDSASMDVHFKTCTPGEQPCDPADPTCAPPGGGCPPSNPNCNPGGCGIYPNCAPGCHANQQLVCVPN